MRARTRRWAFTIIIESFAWSWSAEWAACSVAVDLRLLIGMIVGSPRSSRQVAEISCVHSVMALVCCCSPSGLLGGTGLMDNEGVG